MTSVEQLELDLGLTRETLTMEGYQMQTAETAVYPGAGEGNLQALAYLGLGLGEAGEVQGKLKKVMRDADGEVSLEVSKALAAELGDLLWYVARLADELGYSLEEVAQGNLDKLNSRKVRGVLGGSGDNR